MVAVRPNILFILSDQHRWDALGCAGNDQVCTPNLNKLARRGVMFSNCYAAQAVCSPSRASIFSGLFPTAHGVTDNIYGINDVTSSDNYKMRVTWPGLLREAGYRTGYIGKWHLGEKAPSCFDEWYGWNTGKPHWIGEPHSSDYRSDIEADQAIDFLRRNRDLQFALCLSFYPPHTPYTAPEKFTRMYENKTLEPKEYYGAVSAIDWNIGRVLAELHRLGLSDNTVVIYTSDHGDHFGSRPGNAHKRGAYDDCARIPLIISAPKLFESGTVRSELVSNVDLMPALLDMCGVDIPGGLHGTSLVPLLTGQTVPWRSAVCVQNREGNSEGVGAVQSRGVRTKNWKFLMRESLSDRAEHLRELYDHRTDPHEHNTVYGKENAEVIGSLLLELDYWARSIKDQTTIRLSAACGRDLGLV